LRQFCSAPTPLPSAASCLQAASWVLVMMMLLLVVGCALKRFLGLNKIGHLTDVLP
jgi:hypothetical protein